MTASRSSIVCPATTPYYHCITRVVRRAFLLGDDKASDDDFSHRREWDGLRGDGFVSRLEDIHFSILNGTR